MGEVRYCCEIRKKIMAGCDQRLGMSEVRAGRGKVLITGRKEGGRLERRFVVACR